MVTHRMASTALLFVFLACAPVKAAGQTPPAGESPTGFSGVPWGAGADELIDEFGPPTQVEGEQLRWTGVSILGKTGWVFADVRQKVGLDGGSYVWPFGTEDLGKLQCGLHAHEVRKHLIERYGAPDSEHAGGICGEVSANWRWPGREFVLSLMTLSNPQMGNAVILQYIDLRRKALADQAAAEDRL